MTQPIPAAGAPAAVGPYCHAKRCGNTLYASGQLGLIPETGALAEGLTAQVKQAMENLGAVLHEAGMDYCDVVKTTVFLSDIADFAAANEIYAMYFPQDPPARSCVQAGALPKGGLFEIECIAVK